jgi:hypothetical protein
MNFVTATRRIHLQQPVRSIDMYSFAKDLWVKVPSFIKHPFPITMITANIFELQSGWDFFDSESEQMVKDGSWKVIEDISMGQKRYKKMFSHFLFIGEDWKDYQKAWFKQGLFERPIDITGREYYNLDILNHRDKLDIIVDNGSPDKYWFDVLKIINVDRLQPLSYWMPAPIYAFDTGFSLPGAPPLRNVSEPEPKPFIDSILDDKLFEI